MSWVWKLASEIEVVRAKSCASAVRSYTHNRRGPGTDWRDHYDEHAMTELAMLLESRGRSSRTGLRGPGSLQGNSGRNQ